MNFLYHIYRKVLFLILCVCSLGTLPFFYACSDDVQEETPLQISEPKLFFGPTATSQEVAVSSPGDWTAKVIQGSDWCSCVQQSATLQVIVEDNNTGEKRTALFTDPSDFVLATRLELLGTMWGTGHYRAGPPHGLPQEKDPYFELVNTNLLTTRLALDAQSLPDESQGILPAGISLTFLRTDCRSYVDMRAEDGREWRIFVDSSQWPVTVNGIPVDKCFEGMLFTD